jgi:hypothetical protein
MIDLSLIYFQEDIHYISSWFEPKIISRKWYELKLWALRSHNRFNQVTSIFITHFIIWKIKFNKLGNLISLKLIEKIIEESSCYIDRTNNQYLNVCLIHHIDQWDCRFIWYSCFLNTKWIHLWIYLCKYFLLKVDEILCLLKDM